MKYYFYLHKGKPVSIHRAKKKEKGLHFERWSGNEWISSPDLCFVTGVAASDNYVPVTEIEVWEFLNEGSFA
jgi:hypothetical protein